MLIDLERNDLGRVCVPGSVEVDELMTVESYAHVHHIVSNVRGRLRATSRRARSCAPCFRAARSPAARRCAAWKSSPSSKASAAARTPASLGYLNRDGDLDLNILIRTLTIAERNDRASARAPASSPTRSRERELDETRAKASGLLRALGADP